MTFYYNYVLFEIFIKCHLFIKRDTISEYIFKISRSVKKCGNSKIIEYVTAYKLEFKSKRPSLVNKGL